MKIKKHISLNVLCFALNYVSAGMQFSDIIHYIEYHKSIYLIIASILLLIVNLLLALYFTRIALRFAKIDVIDTICRHVLESEESEEKEENKKD